MWQENASLRAALRGLESTTARWKGLCEELEEEAGELEEEVTRLETELARSAADRSSLDMEKAALEAKLVVKESSLRHLEEENKSRSKRAKVAVTRVKELEHELDENRSELEPMAARLLELEAQIGKHIERESALQAQLRAATTHEPDATTLHVTKEARLQKPTRPNAIVTIGNPTSLRNVFFEVAEASDRHKHDTQRNEVRLPTSVPQASPTMDSPRHRAQTTGGFSKRRRGGGGAQ